jgi:hypothetical protein
VVHVAGGHLPVLVAQLEGLLADDAVGVGADVARAGGDDDGGDGLDGGLAGRRVVAGADGAEAAGFDLGELLEEPLESGPHEEVKHGLGQRAEAGSDAVVVEELEAAGGAGGLVAGRGGGAPEHDDWVVRRPRAVTRGATPVAAGQDLVYPVGAEGATARRGGGASICSRKPPLQPGRQGSSGPGSCRWIR